jgi:hypothetical protein
MFANLIAFPHSAFSQHPGELSHGVQIEPMAFFDIVGSLDGAGRAPYGVLDFAVACDER